MCIEYSKSHKLDYIKNELYGMHTYIDIDVL